ncbi:MAG: helix-turn-helix domain-containing protein [Bacillota bacterium]|nr:helix-turn-helix domain-containing protein [Bacillota bacterium]
MTLEEKQEKLRKQASASIVYQRLKHNMSQKELADRIGTKRSNISRIESGTQNISLDMLVKIQDIFDNKVELEVNEVPNVYETREYSLKLYDEELVQFSFWRDMGFHVTINHINESKKHLFPLDLELTEEGLIRWIDKRIIPNNREFVGEILSTLNLDRGDIKGIVDVCKGLSLNDSYWIIPSGSNLKFDEYNLYENDFADILSLVAYTGRPYSSKKIHSSPELTTNGMLRKGWRNFGSKGIYLYKGGTQEFANAGNEPFSEFYASQIAETMGLHAIKYELDLWCGILASKCKIFTSKDVSYVPIGRIVKTGGIRACLEFYKQLGESFYDELCSMLVFDYVIINEDRHFGNFGLLRDNKTGEFISPAPIFDNGNGLLCYAMDYDFEDIDKYIRERSTPYGLSFDEVVMQVLGKKQKAQLRRLINFKFAESNKYNLPTKRIKALEEIIQKRVQKLLED